MIGPFEEYRQVATCIDSGTDRFLVLRGELDIPPQAELDRIAEAHASSIGIQFESGEPSGYYFVCVMPDGSERQLQRTYLYSLARADEVLEAVRMHLDGVKARYGRGRAWALGGRVHPITDGYDVVCANVDGVPHMCMRSIVVHENGPQHGKPHATTPG